MYVWWASRCWGHHDQRTITLWGDSTHLGELQLCEPTIIEELVMVSMCWEEMEINWRVEKNIMSGTSFLLFSLFVLIRNKWEYEDDITTLSSHSISFGGIFICRSKCVPFFRWRPLFVNRISTELVGQHSLTVAFGYLLALSLGGGNYLVVV